MAGESKINPTVRFADPPHDMTRRAPPPGATHLHGRWSVHSQGGVRWEMYDSPLALEDLPNSFVWEDSEWVGRQMPDGRVFAGRDHDYSMVLISPDDPRYSSVLTNCGPTTKPMLGRAISTNTKGTPSSSNGSHATTGTAGNPISLSSGSSSSSTYPIHDAYPGTPYVYGTGHPSTLATPTPIQAYVSTVHWSQTRGSAQVTPQRAIEPWGTNLPNGNSPLPHAGVGPPGGYTHGQYGGLAYGAPNQVTSYINPPTGGGTTGPTFFPSFGSGPLGGGLPNTPFGNPSGAGPPNGGGPPNFPGGPPSGSPPNPPFPPGPPGGGGPNFPGGGGGGGPGFPGPRPDPFQNAHPTPTPYERFNIKPDIDQYPEYVHAKDYNVWILHVHAIMRSHGCGEVLDPHYTPDPNNFGELVNFNRKQAFAYAMLLKKVKYPLGAELVERYKVTGNAQWAFWELTLQGQSSMDAVLQNESIYQRITHEVFDPKKEKAVDFITRFDQLMRRFNERELNPNCRLHHDVRKRELQRALRPVSRLSQAADRELDGVYQGGRYYSYEQYLQVVLSAATRYDLDRSSRERGMHLLDSSAEIRDIHLTSSEPSPHETVSTDWLINELKRRLPGSMMSKDTWKSLPKSSQDKWDTLPDKDKKAILADSIRRKDQPTSVHLTEVTSPVATDDPMASEGDPDGPIEVHATNRRPTTSTTSISEAHPGDPRRMMSQAAKAQPTKGSPSKSNQINLLSWASSNAPSDDYLTHLVDGCWGADNNPDLDF